MTATELIIINIVLTLIAYEMWQHKIRIRDTSNKKEKNKLIKKNIEQQEEHNVN